MDNTGEAKTKMENDLGKTRKLRWYEWVGVLSIIFMLFSFLIVVFSSNNGGGAPKQAGEKQKETAMPASTPTSPPEQRTKRAVTIETSQLSAQQATQQNTQNNLPKSEPVPPPPPLPTEPTRIDGLVAIRVSGGVWDNWDADVENDGAVLEIVYLDGQGNIISGDTTELLPISADVKIYAGSSATGAKNRLVFSAHYDTNQIILGNIYPKIRIPKEQMSVNPASDYEFGRPVVTIHTPTQGDYSAEGYIITLYEK